MAKHGHLFKYNEFLNPLFQPLHDLGGSGDIHEVSCIVFAVCSGLFLKDSLEKKYPAAPKEFIWQWFFPQKNLTPIPGTKDLRRYHLHESQVQIALKEAVRRAKLTKRVTSHTYISPQLRDASVAGQL